MNQKMTVLSEHKYAPCATMYRLLSGKLPIKATDRKVALYSGEPDPMMPIRSLCPELTIHVAKALQKES